MGTMGERRVPDGFPDEVSGPLFHFTTATGWKLIRAGGRLHAPVHLTTNPEGRDLREDREVLGRSRAQVRITVVLPLEMLRLDTQGEPTSDDDGDAWYVVDTDVEDRWWVQAIFCESGGALWP